MWRCDIPDSNGVQQSIYIYLGTSATGIWCVQDSWLTQPINITTGGLSSVVIYFTLNSEANEDPPEFTLTCQSRGGPVTEVEWMRNQDKVEEDINHMSSQIIVDTSTETVYNNTLRVRGRESGTYECTVSNNRQDASDSGLSVTKRISGMLIHLNKLHMVNLSFLYAIAAQEPLSISATYKSPTTISLEWTFLFTPIYPYSYVAYYQSGGEGYSVAFTIDSLEVTNHELTGLPVGGVHSISLVALVDLPSPVAGPLTPSEYNTF